MIKEKFKGERERLNTYSFKGSSQDLHVFFTSCFQLCTSILYVDFVCHKIGYYGGPFISDFVSERTLNKSPLLSSSDPSRFVLSSLSVFYLRRTGPKKTLFDIELEWSERLFASFYLRGVLTRSLPVFCPHY